MAEDKSPHPNPSNIMVLCAACQQFDLASFAASPDDTKSNSAAAIQRSAEAGCEFCSFIYENASKSLQGVEAQYRANCWIRLCIAGIGTSSRHPQYNRLWITAGESKFHAHWEEGYAARNIWSDAKHEVCIAADPDDAAYRSGMVGGRYLGRTRASPKYLAALGQWLDECIINHPNCRRTISDSKKFDPWHVDLPTRCIQITQDSAFLRETDGMAGSYLTLSHRWDKAADMCKTTPSNYHDRISGQNLTDLSQRFVDAITVARHLRIKYLWIDSICIIQGSQDWDREKTKMGRYYQYSVFTIAAVYRNQMASGGFLDMALRNPIKSIVCLPYRRGGIRQGSLYIYCRDRHVHQQFSQDVDGSDLLSRGWVFQEWHLSKRIVYFAKDETFVECTSRQPMSLCNDLINRMALKGSDTYNLHWQLSAPNNGLKSDLQLKNANGDKDVFTNWYTLIEAYSSTKLTKQADHMVAISGVADEYLTVIRGLKGKGKGKEPQLIPCYLSGLWLDDIHHGLLWRPMRSSMRECDCNAPTWSWLSCAALVAWPERKKKVKTVLSVIAASCEKAPEETPDTIVMTIRITVRTKMLPVLIRRWDGDCSDMQRFTGASWLHDAHSACHMSTPRTRGGWVSLERSITPASVRDCDGTGIIVMGILIATGRDFDDYAFLPDVFGMGTEMYDLLLVEPSGPNTFRRIGVGLVFDANILRDFRESEFVELSLE